MVEIIMIGKLCVVVLSVCYLILKFILLMNDKNRPKKP